MRIAIGMGSNQGDRAGILRAALRDLAVVGDVVAVSSLYRSEPVGGPPQDAYLNAVAVIDTRHDARTVLELVAGIEAKHGRVRSERWGPRTLDLDLIVSDGEPVDDPDLTIPHRRWLERRFVVEPLGEVWPEALPVPAEDLLSELDDQAVERVAGPDWPSNGGAGWGWVAVQVVLYAALALTLLDADSVPLPWLRPVGLVLIAAGALLLGAGVIGLGQNLTAAPEPLPGASLVTHGIYSRVRHPLYGANILAIAGVALYMRSWLGLLVAGAAVVFYRAKAAHEETRLLLRYPGYREYMQSVRRRFLPWP